MNALNAPASVALDALLALLGARLSYLAKKGDADTAALLENQNLVVQISGGAGILRHFIVQNNAVAHKKGPAKNPDVRMHFANEWQGIWLLTAASRKDFAQALKNQDARLQGDIRQWLWFANLRRVALKTPEAYFAYRDRLKRSLAFLRSTATENK